MKLSLIFCLAYATAVLSALQSYAKPLTAAQEAQIKTWPAACQKLVYAQTVTKEDILRCKLAGGIPR